MKKAVLLLALLLIAGCASRKKEVHKTSSTYNFKALLDSLVQSSLKIEFQRSIAQYVRENNSQMNVSYDGKKGDSLSIDQYGPDGNRTSRTVISGSGKADIFNSERTSDSTRDEKIIASSENSSNAKVHKNINEEATQQALDKTVKTSGLSIWNMLWLLLLIIPWLVWRFRKKIKEKLYPIFE